MLWLRMSFACRFWTARFKSGRIMLHHAASIGLLWLVPRSVLTAENLCLEDRNNISVFHIIVEGNHMELLPMSAFTEAALLKSGGKLVKQITILHGFHKLPKHVRTQAVCTMAESVQWFRK